jgi:hypothetical protein
MALKEICSTCTSPQYYYGNKLSDQDTIPLLARLMANAIVQEDIINLAQFQAESLPDYYIPEYYKPGIAANADNTEDPNDSEPSPI